MLHKLCFIITLSSSTSQIACIEDNDAHRSKHKDYIQFLAKIDTQKSLIQFNYTSTHSLLKENS